LVPHLWGLAADPQFQAIEWVDPHQSILSVHVHM
jgi:hypothetical protein